MIDTENCPDHLLKSSTGDISHFIVTSTNPSLVIMPENAIVMDESTVMFTNNSKTELFKADMLTLLLNALHPVSFHQLLRFTNLNRVLKSKHMVVAVILSILNKAKELQLGLCRYQGSIFGFNGVYWQRIETDELKIFLWQAALRLGVPLDKAVYFRFAEELEQQFYTTALLQTPKQPDGQTIINLANGTLVVTDGEYFLKQYDAGDFLTYCLPFVYDRKAEALLFHRYLNEVLPDLDSQKCIAEYLGYIFIRGNRMKLEQVLVLYGKGGNGKSVMQEIINAMFGEENICHYDLEMLTGQNGYYRAVIANKLVNICSEISPKLKPSIFKSLASGEPIGARPIRGEPITIRNYAKLFFNCNTLPTDVEPTDGFFRRWLIAEFPNKFSGDNADINLHRKIIDNELPGVLNWVLEGLTRLLNQNKFTESKLMKDRLARYKQETNNVAMFIAEEHYEPDLINKVNQLELYTCYVQYCQLNHFTPCNNRNFGERLDALGFSRGENKRGRLVFIKRIPVELEEE